MPFEGFRIPGNAIEKAGRWNSPLSMEFEGRTAVSGSLQGNGVWLEPLKRDHLPWLAEAIRDGELWRLTVTDIPHPDELAGYLQQVEAGVRQGTHSVFAIVDLKTSRVAGCTRFRAIDMIHKKAVIGPTFIGRSWQGSHVNTETKYLMLKHAFERWKLNRIELRCDRLNTRSRNAIRTLGATEEGIIRQHLIMPDGRIRDTVVHSILRREWASVKSRLEAKMARFQYVSAMQGKALDSGCTGRGL